MDFVGLSLIFIFFHFFCIFLNILLLFSPNFRMINFRIQKVSRREKGAPFLKIFSCFFKIRKIFSNFKNDKF